MQESDRKMSVLEINKQNIDMSDAIKDTVSDDILDDPEDDNKMETFEQEIDEKDENNENLTENQQVSPQEYGSPEERRQKIHMILEYKNSTIFKDYINERHNLDINYINTLSLIQLDALIQELEYTVSSKNNASLIVTGIKAGINCAEQYVSPFYEIRGLSNALNHNPIFLETLEEIRLKHVSLTYVRPEYRLTIEVVKTAMLINGYHEDMKEKMKTEEGRADYYYRLAGTET
jgi:hypothetical protein